MIGFVIGLVVVGLLAGFIARGLVPGKDAMSVPQTILLGVVGSLVGGVVFNILFLGLRHRGWGPAGLIGSVIGAVIVLLIYNRLTGRKRVERGSR